MVQPMPVVVQQKVFCACSQVVASPSHVKLPVTAGTATPSVHAMDFLAQHAIRFRWDIHLAANVHVFATKVLLLLRPAAGHTHVAMESHSEGYCSLSSKYRCGLHPLVEIWHWNHNPSRWHLCGASRSTCHTHIVTTPHAMWLRPHL